MKIAALWVYPIKGCQGQAVEQTDVTTEGFAGDRQFTLVSEGQSVSQKALPTMKHLSAQWESGGLNLSFSGRTSFRFDPSLETPSESLQLAGRAVNTLDMGDEVADWLSQALGLKLRLVRTQAPAPISIPLDYFSRLEATQQSSFVDVAPLLVTSEASLSDLNARLESPVTMQRFRPNIVVTGTEAFFEDSAEHLRVGSLTLDHVTACERCAVTTFDPDPKTEISEKHKEPLRTLSQYRRRDQGYAGGVMFGSYYAPQGPGVLRVGDALGSPTEVS